MKLIEAGWETYRLKVVPSTASKVQLDETRKAFYAGASHLFAAMMTHLEEGSEETPADLQMMDNLFEELKAFGRSQRG